MRYFSHEECKINNVMRDMYRKEWSGLKHRRHGKRKSGFAGFGEAAFFFCMTYPQKRDANRYKEDQNMPIIHVSETGKQDTQKKRDFMELAANSIRSHTNTLPKNIYVYFHEMEPENVRKTAPTACIDWTMIPDRTNEAKKAIMGKLTDELASLPGRIEAKSQSSSTTCPFRMPCWEESPGQTTTTGKQTQAILFRLDGGGIEAVENSLGIFRQMAPSLLRA